MSSIWMQIAAKQWTWILTLRGWGLVQELAHTLLLVAWRVHLCLRTLGDSRQVGRGLEVEPMVILTANQETVMSAKCILWHLPLRQSLAQLHHDRTEMVEVGTALVVWTWRQCSH